MNRTLVNRTTDSPETGQAGRGHNLSGRCGLQPGRLQPLPAAAGVPGAAGARGTCVLPRPGTQHTREDTGPRAGSRPQRRRRPRHGLTRGKRHVPTPQAGPFPHVTRESPRFLTGGHARPARSPAPALPLSADGGGRGTPKPVPPSLRLLLPGLGHTPNPDHPQSSGLSPSQTNRNEKGTNPWPFKYSIFTNKLR